MSTVLIIVGLSVGAFVLSLFTAFFVTRKFAGKSPKVLSDFVEDFVPKAKRYTFIMSENGNGNCDIVGFCDKGEIVVCGFICKDGKPEFSQPRYFTAENLSYIRLDNMRTHARLYDRDGSLCCTIDVRKTNSLQVCPDFPINTDFTSGRDEFCEFIYGMQKKLDNEKVG